MPWALFYPADYSIGAASLGFQYVFQKLREIGAAVERFFAAPVPYRSVDSDTLLERFPIITASIAYECDVPLFFEWLRDGGIPLSPDARAEGGFPIIGMGGALTYINPLVASGGCDFVILGDGLNLLEEIASILRSYSGGGREKLWQKLAELPSLLVPPLHCKEGLKKLSFNIALNQPLEPPYPMHSLWMSPRGTFGDTLLVELQRGCARSCSYCTLPSCFGKPRFRKFEEIAERLESISEDFKIRQIGLVTPEAGDYPHLSKLLLKLEEKEIGVSFASLRLDRLTADMIKATAGSGRQSITVAPETGSDSLRFACGKKFSNDLIVEKLILAKSLGVERAKLYFMVGLPDERDEDVSAIVSLCRRIIDETGMSLSLSVNPFVPKPRTYWGNENFVGVRTIKGKYEKIKEEMRSVSKKTPQLRLTGIREAEREFRLAWYGYKESVALAASIENFAAALPNANRAEAVEEIERFI